MTCRSRSSWAAALVIVIVGTGLGDAHGASALSATERRIVAAVDRRVPAGLELLQATVDVNSGTLNFDGVRRVGQMFEPSFAKLGFKTRWIDGESFGRAGHLVATRTGKGRRPRVLLIGHLDTVFERDSPFQRFTRTSDSTASGPGTTDMKGGIVVMILALQALGEIGALDRLDVTVVLTGDEEKPGAPIESAREALVEAAKRSDVAFGFEDGDGKPETAVVARRGSTTWTLRAAGKPYHSSQIFREDIGSGAVFEAARILTAFHDSLRGEPLLTFNPGLVLGGTSATLDPSGALGTAAGKSNVIAESTVVVGDLRTISIEQRERTKEAMRRIVEAHLPHTSATIVFSDGYPPLAPSEGNRRLLAIYDRASRDLGFGPVGEDDPRRAGAADVSFTGGLVPMAIDGLGLMGEGGHTVKEVADLRTLPSQAQRIAVTLLRLARTWPRESGAARTTSLER